MKQSKFIKLFAILLFILISNSVSFAQFGGGNGTQTSPYEIYTIEHLMELSDSVENSPANDVATNYNWSRDKHFVLMNDITDSVRFTIGWLRGNQDYVNHFQGDFNGNNKQITLALNGKQKLINGVWANVLDNFIGLFSGLYLANVYDLNVTGYVNGKYWIGGIYGYAMKSNISNCVNRCNVENQGKINATDYSMGYVGGIGGYAEQGNISNCVNYGNIEGYCESIGGIVGYKVNVGVTSCINYGNIESYIKSYGKIKVDSHVGGICGFGYSDSDSDSYFLNCENYGDVSGEMTVGGICGMVGGMHTASNTYLNCENYGDVSGENIIGGITGCMILEGDNASRCTNSGTITGRMSVGGIAGHQHTWTRISNCINIGTVRGDSVVGGISAGYDSVFWLDIETSGNINNCHNAGLIIGKNIVGGIRGGCWGGEIRNSINTGVIIGETNAGGIVGETNNTAIIENCYYDKQMCIHGGIVGNDIAGQAEGYLTKDLIGNNLQAKLGNTDWIFNNANLYPTLKHFEKDSVAFVASSPVYLYDSDVADFDRQNKVRTDFKVNLENDVKWNRIVGNVDIVNDDGIVLSNGNDTLVCGIGNYKRLVPINIQLLPIGDVKFTIWATEHRQVSPTATNYNIPIYVKTDAKTLQEIVIKKLTIEIDENIFYLKRVDNNVTANRNQNEIVIENIKIPPLNAGEEVVLFNLIGDVLLGNIDSSEIIIDTNNIEYSGISATKPELKNGHITLNICREGSDRFVKIADNSPSLSIKNNPVNDILEVECNVLESGKYVLEVVDMAGRSVNVEEFVAGGAGAFWFEIDAKQFSSGRYMVVMVAPSGRRFVEKIVKN